MSTHIKAFISDNDPLYLKHRKVLLFCNDCGVSLPKETADYFGSNFTEKSLLEEKLEIILEEGVHYTKYNNSETSEDGFELELSKLPEGVEKIRLFNRH